MQIARCTHAIFVHPNLSLNLLTPGLLHILALDPYALDLKGFFESFFAQALWQWLGRLQFAMAQ